MMSGLMLSESYPHPPEKVWRALTQSEALATWLMDNNFEARVGHRFQFQDASSGMQVVDCEVLALDPPRRLVYTWQTLAMVVPSTVTWVLTPVEGGTHVQLHHSGLHNSPLKASVSSLGAFPRPYQTLPAQAYKGIEQSQYPPTMMMLPEVCSQQQTSEAGHVACLERPLEDVWRQKLKAELPSLLSSLTAA